MKLSIQNKIILSNILVIVLALVIIATIVIQGMLFFNVEQVERRLINSSNDSNLFIQQFILSQQNGNQTNIDIFKDNAIFLAEELAKFISRTQLYDQSAKLLADSSTSDILTSEEIRDEVEIAINQGEKAYVITKLEEGRFIYFASPIIIENQQLGVLSFLYSLEDVDALINKSVVLFIIVGILGLFILYFISFYLSKLILKPVYSLVTTSKEISEGNYDKHIDYVSSDEIGELTLSFNQMVINIKEKVHEAQSEKQKLESVLSSIEDGVIAVDNDRNILAINEPAKKIFNIMGKIDLNKDIFAHEFMEELFLDIVKEKNGIYKEVIMDNKYLLIYTNIILVDNIEIGYIFVIRDISKIRELEEKQRQFISSVSHELRTPLTTIIGYSDLLERRGLSNAELVEKSITSIKKEGERLLRLVDDLLGLSKTNTMEFELIKSQFDITQLLEDVVSQMRLKGKRYNNEIQFTSTELPKINGDYDRLKQVLINVMDNAIKYSFPRDIIQVYTESTGNYVEIFVRDFGAGIGKNDLDRVFEPFYQVDKVRSTNLGGSGLGLAIAKDIVDNHGGSITIESQINEDTLVIIKLPVS